jgi:hypothetical protein
VEGSCEHGNEPSGSIKYREILEWLRNWRLLKKGLAPWSQLVSLFVEQDIPNYNLLMDNSAKLWVSETLIASNGKATIS